MKLSKQYSAEIKNKSGRLSPAHVNKKHEDFVLLIKIFTYTKNGSNVPWMI